MITKTIPLYGSVIEHNAIPSVPAPTIAIPGKFNNSHTNLFLNQDILSKHILMIGGTGCGKTNVYYHIVNQIKRRLTPNDVMIVFDTKGDYYDLFANNQDYVIGGSFSTPQTVKWNLFKELVADGWNEERISLNTRELSLTMFKEAKEKSKDAFFPNAARDLFATILQCMLNEGKKDPDYKKECLYNSELSRALAEASLIDIIAMIKSHPQFSSVLSYVGDGQSEQALGVYAEMIENTRKLLVSSFAEKGGFSIRNFIRNAGGKTLFIEYDMAIGDSLSPVYSLLFDLALKEVLGRSSNKGNVYLICDEFRLLPNMQHIDDGVNFGRSLGLKVIAGLQSISQFTEAYGESKGKNILSGFSSVFAFHANDAFTRDYIVKLHGKNVVLEQYKSLSNSIHEERQRGNVVEDWNMSNLNIGEAIISYPFSKPFAFQFDLYNKT